jgi:hypothetical protein
MFEKLRKIAPTAAPAPAKPALAARFAAPNVKPESWQVSRAPLHTTLSRMRPPVSDSPEVARVVAIPRRPPLDLESPEALALAREVTARFSRLDKDGAPRQGCACAARGRPCFNSLKPVQAWALSEMAKTSGLLGKLGVGSGKTLLNVLAPLAVPNTKVAVVLVPPTLVGQLHAEYLRIAEHFRVPSLVLPTGGGQIHPGRPVLHVVPYSRFSRPEATELLKKISPDLIIADEAHRLKAKDTSTTSRVLRYFAENPRTRLCAWSGTLTSKSVRDYGHVSAIALGEASPLPLDPNILEEWSLALDPIEWRAPAGALFELCRPGEDVRDGFRRRMDDTLGVVGTRASPVDASIILAERVPPPIPAKLNTLLKHLRSTWERPDGEELVDILQVAKSARELACGFFYRWTFPRGEPTDLIDRWFKVRSAWHKELREKLKHRVDHLDSPLLCAKAAIRAWSGYEGPLPTWRAETWPSWVEIRDRVQPEPVAEWVDEYLANDAAEWARKHRGIVWCDFDTFGRKTAAILGKPYYGGLQSDQDLFKIGPDGKPAGLAITGKESVVLSVKKYHEGVDGLQYLFHEQLIANLIPGAARAEQLLGRTHRIGQSADEVTAHLYRHTIEMAESFDRALEQAKYIESTLGTYQKLLAATPTWEK